MRRVRQDLAAFAGGLNGAGILRLSLSAIFSRICRETGTLNMWLSVPRTYAHGQSVRFQPIIIWVSNSISSSRLA